MAAIAKAAICVFGGVGAVFWACRRAGMSWEWIGRHLLSLVLAAFAVALACGYASEKPAPPPALSGRFRHPAVRWAAGTNDCFRPLMPAYDNGRRIE